MIRLVQGVQNTMEPVQVEIGVFMSGLFVVFYGQTNR